jgi:hypothetical protein
MLNNPLNSSACISFGNQLKREEWEKIGNYEIGGLLHTLFIIQPIYGNCDYLTLTRCSFRQAFEVCRMRGHVDEWMEGKNVGKLQGDE